MLRHFLLLAAVSVPGLSAAVTYTYAGANYSHFIPFTSCTIGTCANFTTSMNVQGSFTTSVPLAANLTFQDISAQLLSYSFTDGLDTFTNTDPNTRIWFFTVSTDGVGRISYYAVTIQVWKSGTSPHQPSDRISFLAFTSNQGGNSDVAHNIPCISISAADTPDTCVQFSNDAATSNAAEIGNLAFIVGPPGVDPPAPVPALSVLAMAVLAATLAWIAWSAMSRSRVA
jgi:hypothetical protein